MFSGVSVQLSELLLVLEAVHWVNMMFMSNFGVFCPTFIMKGNDLYIIFLRSILLINWPFVSCFNIRNLITENEIS